MFANYLLRTAEIRGRQFEVTRRPAPGNGNPHMLGPIQRIDTPMHRFSEGEELDYVIVGLGAGGGVLLQRLARAGLVHAALASFRFPSSTGVTYFDPEEHEHFQKAQAVNRGRVLHQNTAPLTESACPGFENGLANSSDCVGRYLMAQAGNVVLSRFEELVRMYKALPAHAWTEELYETDPKRGFARGFAIQTVGPLPMALPSR